MRTIIAAMLLSLVSGCAAATLPAPSCEPVEGWRCPVGTVAACALLRVTVAAPGACSVGYAGQDGRPPAACSQECADGGSPFCVAAVSAEDVSALCDAVAAECDDAPCWSELDPVTGDLGPISQ